ncbi:MAG: 50S ribosomal protein L29 [Alphaproteobacteria bacterium]|nr:MAG: 50S ribosomal protein L29 [Alphaproteobacteria bacterium]
MSDKGADTRAKSEKELAGQLQDLRRESMNLRFQRATGQLKNTARVREARRAAARILTIQNQRRSEAATTGSGKSK